MELYKTKEFGDACKNILKNWDKIFPSQPERLNPEDHIAGVGKLVCDSLNSENK